MKAPRIVEKREREREEADTCSQCSSWTGKKENEEIKEKTQGEQEKDIRSEVLNYSSFKTHQLLQWEGEHTAKKESRCRNERLKECMREK